MLERYKRGQRFYGADTTLVVLGGPKRISASDFYTVVATNDGAVDFGAYGHLYRVKQGETAVVHGAALQVVMRQGEIWTEKEIQYFQRYYPLVERYAGIITQECPSCGIEEMIFYSEDYMCAWCREVLEDDL